MQKFRVLVALSACAFLAGCGGALRSQQAPAHWSTGFWIWQNGAAEVALPPEALDAAYLHVGSIFKEQGSPRQPWTVYGGLPNRFPEAREYWLVYRYERQGVPDSEAAPVLVRQALQLREIARQKHLNVAGIQLDIDSPTGSLTNYAAFLGEVRKGLPPDCKLSITALLDWFRDGTSIGEVIRQTDEFVPQFYDAADPRDARGPGAIAEKIDAAEWAPRFNRFQKQYRIGISSFGRPRLVAGPGSSTGASLAYGITPLDVALNPAFTLQTSRNAAQELLLNYRATRKTRLDYVDLQPGDAVQFILGTAETVRAAVESAKRLRGYCAGVIFFRWPQEGEKLVMQPDQVLFAAGAIPQQPNPTAHVRAVNGSCAAVSCEDIFLLDLGPLSDKPLRYRIRSAAPLEYFLPEEKIPARMTGDSTLELSLPPYCGRGQLFLGRAVSKAPNRFTVEEEP